MFSVGGLPGWLSDKNLPACQCRRHKRCEFIPRARRSPGVGRSPGGEHENSLGYSCLENSMDRGAGWATVQKSQKVGLSQLSTQALALCSLCLMVVNYINSSGEGTSLGPYLLMTTLKQEWFGDLLKATE